MPEYNVPTATNGLSIRLLVADRIPINRAIDKAEAYGYFGGMRVFLIRGRRPIPKATVQQKCTAISFADFELKAKPHASFLDRNIQTVLNAWQGYQYTWMDADPFLQTMDPKYLPGAIEGGEK